MNSVAILGGSFNPVHIGHVKLAEWVQSRCGFKPLWIVPSQNPPHKSAYEANAEQRLEMVKLAFSSVADAQVSTFEIENEGPSYAIRTIEYFSRKHPGQPLFFVLGADTFQDLPHWYAFPDVMEACSYLVVTRAGWETDAENSKLTERLEKLVKAGLLVEEPNNVASPTPFDKVYRTRSGTRVCLLNASLPEVSSTEIRLRLQLGQEVHGRVPEAVERYLKTTGLYGTSKAEL